MSYRTQHPTQADFPIGAQVIVNSSRFQMRPAIVLRHPGGGGKSLDIRFLRNDTCHEVATVRLSSCTLDQRWVKLEQRRARKSAKQSPMKVTSISAMQFSNSSVTSNASVRADQDYAVCRKIDEIICEHVGNGIVTTAEKNNFLSRAERVIAAHKAR